MLKLIGFIVSILLIIVIFLRTPQENVGLSSFATKSDILGSPSSAERFLNILTISGIVIYFGVALVLNLHGLGSNSWQQMFYGDFRPIADTANFIIVHPQGTFESTTFMANYWNAFHIDTVHSECKAQIKKGSHASRNGVANGTSTGTGCRRR